jgi:regulator of replication initiation timing
MPHISFTLLEIIILISLGVGLGITIHFFLVSRRSLKNFSPNPDKINQKLEEWKRRYFNDMERKDQEIIRLKTEANQLSEKFEVLGEENDNLRYKLSRLHEAKQQDPAPVSSTPVAGNYMQQLEQAQRGLMEQNLRIAELVRGIEAIKGGQDSGEDLRKANEGLQIQLEETELKLHAKEQEIKEFKQASQVSNEMSSMLENAYREFNVLQDKIVKLESQVHSSQKINMDYEDLREGFYKASRDIEEQRNKLGEMMTENRDLQMEISETTDKLREANFQRQQLQKKVAYLEELNQDLQTVAEANRKLENQLKRIGELESLLQVMAAERDQLARNQENASSFR